MSGGEPAVPTLTFDSDAFPAGQALALWLMSVPYDASLPEGVGDDAFRAQLRAWRVESLLVTEGSQAVMRFVRTPNRVAADGRDNLCLMLTPTAAGAATSTGWRWRCRAAGCA